MSTASQETQFTTLRMSSACHAQSTRQLQILFHHFKQQIQSQSDDFNQLDIITELTRECRELAAVLVNYTYDVVRKVWQALNDAITVLGAACATSGGLPVHILFHHFNQQIQQQSDDFNRLKLMMVILFKPSADTTFLMEHYRLRSTGLCRVSSTKNHKGTSLTQLAYRCIADLNKVSYTVIFHWLMYSFEWWAVFDLKRVRLEQIYRQCIHHRWQRTTFVHRQM